MVAAFPGIYWGKWTSFYDKVPIKVFNKADFTCIILCSSDVCEQLTKDSTQITMFPKM